MKCLFLLLSLHLLPYNSFSQTNEFGVASNALIYPDTIMNQLKFIVDSLNLKFRVCELNKTYLSKQQAVVHYLSVEGSKAKLLKADIENNLAWEIIMQKHKNLSVEKGLLAVKYQYKSYENKDIVEMSIVGGKNENTLEYGVREFNNHKPLKGKWLYKYYSKSDYSNESIDAIYFTEDLVSVALPHRYARMIQYSNCMVDTTAQVYYKNAGRQGRWGELARIPEHVKGFIDYVHHATQYPSKDKNFIENYRVRDSLRLHRVDSINLHNRIFRNKLDAAIQQALEKGYSLAELEEYAGRYVSKKVELELKRHRIVVGGCSQDQAPRFHALRIAKLSAETVNWEVFLRSHLDIMNDHFERVSDGSYAQAERQTYISELEALEINVTDLLLGISFRIGNPGQNHYFGDIGRLGRALAESKNKDVIENNMLAIVADKQLDSYNRIVIGYLFKNYNFHLQDKRKQELNRARLLKAANDISQYITSSK